MTRPTREEAIARLTEYADRLAASVLIPDDKSAGVCLHNSGVRIDHERAADLRALLSLFPEGRSEQDQGGDFGPSRTPPPHWTAANKHDRHPKTAGEWDWRNDPPEPERLALAIRRLNFAGDLADPRAPDQMALVLRKDLIGLKQSYIGMKARSDRWREALEERDAARLRIKALEAQLARVQPLLSDEDRMHPVGCSTWQSDAFVIGEEITALLSSAQGETKEGFDGLPELPCGEQPGAAVGATAALAGCHADRDGECRWIACPQILDNEPEATGRHCPLDLHDDEEA